MKVLITGGAGFIGSYFARLLLTKGYDVVIVDDLSTGLEGNIPPGAVFYHRSVTDYLGDIFKEMRPDKVVHMAAQVSVAKSLENPVRDASINLLGGLNLLDQCVNFGVKKVVYASSAAVYGDPEELPLSEDHPKSPLSPYGINKLTFEKYLESYRQNFGLDYTVLRYANVYGPGQLPGADGGVVAIFTDKIAKNASLSIYGDGEQTRDFIYVEDAAVANWQALHQGSGQVLNIGGGRETSINQLTDILSQLWGGHLDLKYQQPRPGDIDRSVFQIDRAQEVLAFTAQYSLQEGLKRTLEAEGLIPADHFRGVEGADD